MCTLTYAGTGCHDVARLREDVAGFFKGLRPALGGSAFPYVWVSEWHPGGHGLHAHLAVGRYVPQRLLRDRWGRGHVFVRLVGDLPVGSGPIDEARVAAAYLCKYVGKDFGDAERPAGLHRYEVAQGFQPRRVTVTGSSERDVLEQASVQMGRQPAVVWRSSDEEEWHGPPACWASWSD